MRTHLKRTLRYGASLPAVLAFCSLNIAPIQRRLFSSYLSTKEAHRPKLPQVSSLEGEIANGLEQEGVFITSMDALATAGTAEMFAAGERISANTAGAARHHWSGRKVVNPNTQNMANYSILFRWGLEPSLLRVAERYFGLPVAYDGPKVSYTPADGREAGTRLWHRDREDRRMLKIVVYIDDVPEDGGPIQCLKRDVFDGPVDGQFEYPIISNLQLGQKLGRPITDSEITSCTGPAGTVIFMDTARLFHRGKPSLSKDRRAIFHSYFSRTPRHPFFCERSDLSRAQIAKLAAEVAPWQREAALWRNALPDYARLIPRSVT